MPVVNTHEDVIPWQRFLPGSGLGIYQAKSSSNHGFLDEGTHIGTGIYHQFLGGEQHFTFSTPSSPLIAFSIFRAQLGQSIL